MYEAEDDEREVDDIFFFNKFLQHCKQNNIEYQQILCDLGVTLPPNVFSDSCLEELIGEMLLEQKEARWPRQQLTRFCHFDKIVECFQECENIVFMCGAGMSVSAGIPDFRSENGIYSQLDKYNLEHPTDMFDLTFFAKNPIPFYSFAPEIIPQQKYQPTFSHIFLRHLFQLGKLRRVYTQNIDGLERKAGLPAELVIPCHGCFDFATCQSCGFQTQFEVYSQIINQRRIPLCPKCSTRESCSLSEDVPKCILKPNIVFFGDRLPNEFENSIDEDFAVADLVVVIGSSMKVKPFCGTVGRVPRYVPQLLINVEPNKTHYFDCQLVGYSDIILGEIARASNWTELLQTWNRNAQKRNVELASNQTMGKNFQVPLVGQNVQIKGNGTDHISFDK